MMMMMMYSFHLYLTVINDAFVKLDNEGDHEDVLDDNKVPPASSDTSDCVTKKN